MEPIAIVGIGCRFPGGANNPESFWELLSKGIDATRDIPKERWDIQTFYDPDKSIPGKTYTYHGGFLERVDEFDAQFFEVSPREAAYLDPQQRILLEIVWEAMEDAGIDPQKLEGSNTGVYIGAFIMDYQLIQMKYVDFIDTHTAIGSMLTMASNRISYIFDLRGPSISVDTACSGSLVAIHLSCQSIWNNQCPLVIAGGVNVITTPEYTIAESKGGFLSPEGRCKTFDAGADGFARGEGAGVVILKPLAQALADNDFVYAVIRGTGANQDGHTNGITVPRGESQEDLMREVYRNAGISPQQIRYVEAHGTGTPTGDPIEANAIANVFGANLPPDWVLASKNYYMGFIPAMIAELNLQESSKEEAAESENGSNASKASYLQTLLLCDPATRKSPLSPFCKNWLPMCCVLNAPNWISMNH